MINPCAISSYLTFRYLVDPKTQWKHGIKPKFPNTAEQSKYGVKDSKDTLMILEKIVKKVLKEHPNTGILLSSGVDSAILAKLLPKRSQAYTIKFLAEGAIDESIHASIVAKENGLAHKIIEVSWKDYIVNLDKVLLHKKSPLHPAEIGLYMAANKAKDDGVKNLITGIGADSTFGGLDKLLSKDWKFEEFVRRYTFCDPKLAVKKPISMASFYKKYKTKTSIDVKNFLKVIHGLGIIQVFNNSLSLAGCNMISPYEELFLDSNLDLERIRKGESKYILREIFKKMYPNLKLPSKIAFARPMDQWLKEWRGPKRKEFKSNLNINTFTGEQKWQLFNLERFLNLVD